MVNSSFKKTVITKQQLKTDLAKMGISIGDHIAVALSLKSIGFVEGGPDTFIDALLETVGSQGTVMMNTYTEVFPIYRIVDDFVYDSKSTRCWTGIVPETFRKRKEAIRSNHPCSSVAAIGKKAVYLTKNHIDDSRFSPYSRLARIKGKFLAIGLENRLVAIRHEAQQQAGLLQMVKRPVGIKYKDYGGKQRLFVCNSAPCVKGIGELTPIMKRAGILKEGKVGNAQSLLVNANESINFLTNMLKKDLTLNLCKNSSCLWCREVERKYGLCKNVTAPRYFQKYKIVQGLFALRISFALKKYNYISYRRKSINKLRVTILGVEIDKIVEDACWALVDFLNLRPKFYFRTRKKGKISNTLERKESEILFKSKKTIESDVF